MKEMVRDAKLPINQLLAFRLLFTIKNDQLNMQILKCCMQIIYEKQDVKLVDLASVCNEIHTLNY